jgi:hypothetical protein
MSHGKRYRIGGAVVRDYVKRSDVLEAIKQAPKILLNEYLADEMRSILVDDMINAINFIPEATITFDNNKVRAMVLENLPDLLTPPKMIDLTIKVMRELIDATPQRKDAETE